MDWFYICLRGAKARYQEGLLSMEASATIFGRLMRRPSGWAEPTEYAPVFGRIYRVKNLRDDANAFGHP